MCFSAGASFGASAVIGAISVACFVKAKTPALRVWACIPLLFSIQQAVEGTLWLSLSYSAYRQLYTPALYGFLIFAEVLWPVMIPLAAYAPEPERKRGKILKVFLLIGCTVAVYHLLCLFSYPVMASAQAHHIHYVLQQPAAVLRISGIIYFIPAVFPLFFSSLQPVRWWGIALVCSYICTRIFYQPDIISIWCYLAAVLSGIVFFIIGKIRKLPSTMQQQ